ncbi:DUF4194 domain-containing protein [Mycoplasmatota bacterium WC44]
MWEKDYELLSTSNKKQFSDVANKLLSINFLVKSKPENTNMYYFVSKNLALFNSYFKIINWELDINNDLGVISLKNTENRNRLNLKLNETITLLILRLLYEQNSDEIDLNNNVEIKVSDIHEMFAIIGLESRILNKKAINEILSLFRRYNLILVDNVSALGTDDILYILPSILMAVETTNILDIYKKLRSFGSNDDGGDDIEDLEEDKVN